MCIRNRLVSEVVQDIAIGAGGLGSIPRPVESAQCRQWLAPLRRFFGDVLSMR